MRASRHIALVWVGCLATALAEADSWADLADIAARIEYGFHAEEPGMVEAAHDELARAGTAGEAAAYYRALAALRLGSLMPPGSSREHEWLETCARLTPAEDARTRLAAEAWVVVAACAFEAARGEPMRGLLLQRRAAQALERAAALDPGNPRLALVRARSLAAGPELTAALEAAVQAFELPGTGSGPDWGEAEALALLAEARLAEGRLQAARDLVERSLLVAGDYRFALALRERVLGTTR